MKRWWSKFISFFAKCKDENIFRKVLRLEFWVLERKTNKNIKIFEGFTTIEEATKLSRALENPNFASLEGEGWCFKSSSLDDALSNNAVESRTFELNLETNLEPHPNFEPIFGFEIRAFDSRRVGSSRRFEKFDFESTRRIPDSKKFEGSTALMPFESKSFQVHRTMVRKRRKTRLFKWIHNIYFHGIRDVRKEPYPF